MPGVAAGTGAGAGDGRRVVAVDGKTICGARTGQGSAPHLVSAVIHGDTVVLGQRRAADKSNEIPTVRKLLCGVDIAGAVVTVDTLSRCRDSREDRSTVRAGYGPQVMATFRNVAVSLHRRTGHTNIARACRRLAANPHHATDLVLRA